MQRSSSSRSSVSETLALASLSHSQQLTDAVTSVGVNHYAFHDIDIAPEGATLAETEKIFHDVTDHALEHQKSSGVGLLWATQNLFSHPRFMNGGATNPNLDCYAWACAKTKMALDVGHKLGGENHVFWGGREGYQSTLNTDAKKELDNLAVRSK